MAFLPTCTPYPIKKPHTRGKCRGLFIGINYTGTSAELSGCVNDVSDMIGLLEKMNFPMEEAIILVDDPRFPNNCGFPTHDNIILSMQWLTRGAKNGDLFFLHFSGHGTQITSKMRGPNEPDGMDEAIVPCDYEENGLITDDTIFQLCARTLPPGARLTALLDCCHSGTLMDLPFCFTASDTSNVCYSPSTTNMCAGDVVMISGCADTQTSADATGANFTIVTENTPGRAGGACTGALQDTILNNRTGRKLSFAEVLLKMRDSLADRGFKQIPQLSCSKALKVDALFDLRGDVATEDLTKVEDVSVEVTTTVKPQPLLNAAALTEGVVSTPLPPSYTPFTFTFTYPYHVASEQTVPSNYWYYDPYLAATATLTEGALTTSSAAAADTSSWLDEVYKKFEKLYRDLPNKLTATVTEVSTLDELEEDPADVGNKTLADLLTEAPHRPSEAITVQEPELEFEPLPDECKTDQVVSRPGDWHKNPICMTKPESYHEFRRHFGKHRHLGRHGGYGAGRKWYQHVGDLWNTLTRGRLRAEGHGARIALPIIDLLSHGNEANDEFVDTLKRKGFGFFSFGTGGDDRGRERRERKANQMNDGPVQHEPHHKNHRSHEGHAHARKASPKQYQDEIERNNESRTEEDDEDRSHSRASEVQQVFDNRPPKHRPNPPRGGPPKGYGKVSSKRTQSFYDRIGSFVIPTAEDDLRELFSTFDADGDGKIDLDEFVNAMVEFQSQLGLHISPSDAKRAFSRYDSNNDGRLSYDEFAIYMLALAKM